MSENPKFEGLEGEQKWFYHWIIEREKCRIGRETGADRPWTLDKILQSYRFCNIQRSSDKVTKWIHTNWCAKYENHPNMIYAMALSRMINRIETLSLVGFPDFEPAKYSMWKDAIIQQLKKYRAEGNKVWTGAYLVSTNGRKMDKIEYVFNCVLDPIYHGMKSSEGDTLASFAARLQNFDGMGSFMTGQVVADLKYTSVLDNAADWHSWATIGPGSRRGLNRYFGRKLEGVIGPTQFSREIAGVQLQVQERLGIKLHAQDIQNCFCEFDKYVRTKNGEGKPRSSYSGR